MAICSGQFAGDSGLPFLVGWVSGRRVDMCTGGGKVRIPKAEPIEPPKSAQGEMATAMDDTARRQMMRRGLMSTFSGERGLGEKADKLG